MNKRNDNGGIVYSTEYGKMCPKCSKQAEKCVCRQKKALSKSDGIVRIGRETKGRKGKGVTLITGVPLDESELKQLGKELKQKCGTGGTIKNDVIEIQGDQRERLMAELKKYGWVVKLSGG
ncbi:MAG: translation initiation factor Sui1 [Desulfobacterales bacterium]|nr:translation initiation factor Sui1 [Desulfobacterales bacterium]